MISPQHPPSAAWNFAQESLLKEVSALGHAGPGKEGDSSQDSKLLHVAQDLSICQHVHSSPITAGAELGISL